MINWISDLGHLSWANLPGKFVHQSDRPILDNAVGLSEHLDGELLFSQPKAHLIHGTIKRSLTDSGHNIKEGTAEVWKGEKPPMEQSFPKLAILTFRMSLLL